MRNESKRHKKLARKKVLRKKFERARNMAHGRSSKYEIEVPVVRPVLDKDGRQVMKEEKVVSKHKVKGQIVEETTTIQRGVYEKVGVRKKVGFTPIRVYAGAGTPESRKFTLSKKEIERRKEMHEKEVDRKIKQVARQTATNI